MHTGLIEAEAQRIVADMKRLAAPNSPDKNHFMVEVSPYFTKLASSRDTDQLLAMLPYKSLHLSSVKDRFGIYALVGKNENRDKGISKNKNAPGGLVAALREHPICVVSWRARPLKRPLGRFFRLVPFWHFFSGPVPCYNTTFFAQAV